MSENYCGDCTLCCKLMSVVEIQKPRASWCPHVAGDKHGCTIYADRPAPCEHWACGWWRSQRSANPLPPQLRPDRCHVVINQDPKGITWLHVDPDYSEAWRKAAKRQPATLQQQGIGDLLNKLVTLGHKVVICIGLQMLLFRKGQLPIHFYETPSPMEKVE